MRSVSMWQALLSRRTLFVVGGALVAGIIIGVLPSLALKAALVVGVAGMITAVELARRGQVLDPAWVIVAQLYFIAPIGVVVTEFGLDISALVILNLVFVPFLAAALVRSPRSRPGLVCVAPLMLFALIAAVSTTWSVAAGYGVEKLNEFLVNGLLPATAIAVLYSAKREVNWNLVVGMGFVYAVAVIIVGTGWTDDPSRRTLFDVNPIAVGRSVIVVAVLAVFGPFRRVAKAVMAPVMVIAGALTLSSGPLVGLAGGILAGSAETLRLAARQGRRTMPGWIALVVVPGIGLIILLSGVLDPIVAPMMDDPNVAARAIFLAASGPLIESSPLFGIGFGGFSSTGLHEYPHNLPVEVMVELGLVGSIVLFAWVVLAFWGALGSPMMVAAIVTTGVFTLFSGSVASQTIFWVFSALAVSMLAAARGSSKRPMTDTSGSLDGRSARQPI